MTRVPTGRGRFRSRGVAVPLVLAAVSIFLGALAVIVDGATMLLSRSELEGLCDVAALTAASAAGPSRDAAAAARAVRAFLDANGCGDCDSRVLVEGSRITVVLARSVPLVVTGRTGGRRFGMTCKSGATLEGGRLRLLP